MKKECIKGYIAGVLTVVILGGAVLAGKTYIKTEYKESIGAAVEDKLDYLKEYIDAYYLDDTDVEKMEDGIYKGLVNSLGDPYSAYFTKDEYNDIIESQSGEYCGIGVAVTKEADSGLIRVVTVYDGTPAKEAGIKENDILYKVKGKEVTGSELDKVVAEIKGSEGTTVDITVYRSSNSKYIDMKVERRTIEVPTISYKMLDNDKKIGYIQITQFDENTDEQFSDAMADLKKKGMKSVIFDVRNNPGGLYDTVCNMLDELLPEGTLVYTLDKYGKKEEKTSDAKCLDIPMAVLINGDSASASEIFAGAIQDFGAGKIIGTQSFGKGIVQSLFSLNDGSAIKLTISKYYTPKGVNIHGKGITPDIKVEAGSDEKKDPQLDRAVEELSK